MSSGLDGKPVFAGHWSHGFGKEVYGCAGNARKNLVGRRKVELRQLGKQDESDRQRVGRGVHPGFSGLHTNKINPAPPPLPQNPPESHF